MQVQQNVVKLEKGTNDKGPLLKITTQKKDGTVKQRTVFGELIGKFEAGPGNYLFTFADDTHYLTDAERVGALQAVTARPVESAGATAGYDTRSKSIEMQVCLKATAEVTAAFVTGNADQAIADRQKDTLAFAEAMYGFFSGKAGL